MSKNMQRAPKAAQKKSRGGTLIGLFIGLVVGLGCAFGIAWYLKKSPLPFVDKSDSAHGVTTGSTPAASTAPNPNTGNPAALPGKPGEKPVGAASEKPRFEFYKILPGGQEAASGFRPPEGHGAQDEDRMPVDESAPPPAPVVSSFYLQAGSFQKSVDADNLKARLALMGLDTRVQEANIPEKGVVYRVRVGPFVKPEEMNRVRNQLSQSGIQASVVKMKDKPEQQ